MSARPLSVTQIAIRHVANGHVASLLKLHDFRRSAPHFWRNTDGVYQAINFQASQWGSADEGRFTINLGITSRDLYFTFTGRPFPKNPGTAIWPIYLRIGGLLPTRCDLWWDVTRTTNLSKLDSEVAHHLETYAVPWLNGIRRPGQLNKLLLSEDPLPGVIDNQRDLIGASMAMLIADEKTASILLKRALVRFQGSAFEARVRSMAKELKVPLDVA